MKRYLLDTNAVGDFLNHRHGIPQRVHDARTRGIVLGTCEPVVAELYFGVENSATRDENLKRLKEVVYVASSVGHSPERLPKSTGDWLSR